MPADLVLHVYMYTMFNNRTTTTSSSCQQPARGAVLHSGSSRVFLIRRVGRAQRRFSFQILLALLVSVRVSAHCIGQCSLHAWPALIVALQLCCSCSSARSLSVISLHCNECNSCTLQLCCSCSSATSTTLTPK
jgi:hypothetical protein